MIKVLTGDCIDSMGMLDSESVNCCVTSPPYFGLRDYGHECQFGLEASPSLYVQSLVRVFEEVKRVLRPDGTLWLNLGDSYVSKPTGGQSLKASKMTGGRANQIAGSDRPDKTGFGLAEKQMIGIPWRVAFALQENGWYLRQEIIWSKPNPMPESVRDRCVKSHEQIFLFSKSPKYHFNYEAIREDALNGEKRTKRSVWSVAGKPFKGAHFATFPVELIEPCILAGCPVGGTVLDPFGGSGTTGVAAKKNGRSAVLCELNPEYAQMARDRINSFMI